MDTHSTGHYSLGIAQHNSLVSFQLRFEARRSPSTPPVHHTTKQRLKNKWHRIKPEAKHKEQDRGKPTELRTRELSPNPPLSKSRENIRRQDRTKVHEEANSSDRVKVNRSAGNSQRSPYWDWASLRSLPLPSSFFCTLHLSFDFL